MNAQQTTQPANPAPVLTLAIPPGPPERLSTEERTRLQKLERMMDLGMERFLVVGEALIEIKESRLYREKYPTFRAYCEQRWSMSGRHGYRLIQAYEARLELADVTRGSHDADRMNIADPVPLSAKALLALAPVAGDQKAEIVEAAKASNNGEATARAINTEIARRAHRKQPGAIATTGERRRPPSAELASGPGIADSGGARGGRPKRKTNGKPKVAKGNHLKANRSNPFSGHAGSEGSGPSPSSYLSEYDEWQDKRAARWQRDFGARAWRAYNAQVFAILREVREWWAGKLEGGA